MTRDPNGHLVEREFLTLAVWDQFDAGTASEVARSVERCLPEPWTFLRIERRECGDQARHVAFFEHQTAVFSLIPGGTAVLGYDPARPEPSPALLDAWYEEVRAMWGDDPETRDTTWGQYLAEVLSPLRTATVGPFLIRAEAERRNRELKSAAARAAIAQRGLRLPTADEWEYACAAGTRSVWHWGDDPTDGPPTENAFGLVVCQNTYDQEALAEPNHFRGGDGGQREHGGACELERFVPLSSWFRSRGVNGTQEDWWDYTMYRPVFQIPEAALG